MRFRVGVGTATYTVMEGQPFALPTTYTGQVTLAATLTGTAAVSPTLFPDVHLVVDSGNGRSKSSGVRRIEDDDRVAELARMLAGLGESDSGRAHARELLEAAQQERNASD